MQFDPRQAALAATMALCACGQQARTPPPPRPPPPIVADATTWAGLSRGQAQALRAALMQAQVEIAQRLVAEGAGGAASGHIQRVLSELYMPAKADYARQNLGLNEETFRRAAQAAGTGASFGQMRSSMEEMLRQIERLQPRDEQWSKPGAAKMLLTELSHEYGEGVQGGFVVNESRYQDAFGLALVTRKIIDDAVKDGVAKDPSRSPELEREAEGLVNMFTTASAPKSPADAGEMLAQINRVQLAFPGME